MGRFNSKNPDPPFPSSPSNTLFTSERSNMDYFTLAGEVKKSLSEIDLRKMAEANPMLQARLNNKTLFGKDFSLFKGLKK
ncbi:MAG: hypothetical protein ACRD8W_19735 [Nitrososphaeraceae archaeon]